MSQARLSARAAMAAAILLAFAAAPVFGGEELNLSRSGWVLEKGTLGFIDAQIDHSFVIENCRDHDGCTISLKIDGPSGITFTVERLFLSEYSLKFRTSRDSLPHQDDDDIIDVVASVEFPGGGAPTLASCRVDDDTIIDGGPDGGEGFDVEITVLTAGDYRCVLHIID